MLFWVLFELEFVVYAKASLKTKREGRDIIKMRISQ